MKPIVFSGIRPSGQIHLGNYLGAVKNWLELQKTCQCIFSVVDYHAITTPFEPQELKDNIYNVVLDYLALGIDPKKSILTVQSHVPEHLELAWILGTLTPKSLLERIPTYKEAVVQYPQYVNLGLLSYPVLMAADILIYKATKVPVGFDQLPHIELAKDLARRFNNKFGITFPSPEAVLTEGAKIMSLKDPTKKMSKTGDEGIALFDSPEVIREKIKRAVTDSGQEITFSPDKPAISNLLIIYQLLSGKPMVKILAHAKGMNYSEFKTELAEIVVESLAKFRAKRIKLAKNPGNIEKILADGAKKAKKIADKTMLEVKEKVGLI